MYKSKYALLCLFLILTISIFFRIYHAEKKTAFHGDELLSFQIVNGTYGREEIDAKFQDKWIAGTEYLNYYFTVYRENFSKDIKMLFKDTKDDAHPNLYYVALRLLLFQGIRGVDGAFKHYGIGLNILFYGVSAIFLFLLYYNIYNNINYSLLAVFLFSVSLGAISNSLYLRMYELFSTFVIITTFLAFQLIDRDKPSLLYLCLLFVSFTIGYLSHYLYTIFIIFLSTAIVYHSLIGKQFRNFFYYCITMILSFFAAHAIYPRFIPNFKNYRAVEAYSKIDIGFFVNNLINKFMVTYELITHNIIYFFFPIFIAMVILISFHQIKKTKNFNSKEIYLLLVSFSFSLFAIYISPYENARYLFGVLSLLIIVPIMFIRLFPTTISKVLIATVICAIYIFANFNSSSIQNSHLGRFTKQRTEKEFNSLIFRDNPATPVYFISIERWIRGEVIAHFKESQMYKLINSKEPVLNFSDTESAELYLLVEKGVSKEFLKKQIKSSNWSIIKKTRYGYYDILLIEKENRLACLL